MNDTKVPLAPANSQVHTLSLADEPATLEDLERGPLLADLEPVGIAALRLRIAALELALLHAPQGSA